MKLRGTDLRRAAPLVLLFGAMACGPGIGGGGCGPSLDADKIAEEAAKGTDGKGGGAAGAAAARSKMSDALAAKGDGYKPGAYADKLEGFSSTGGSNGTPKGEYARLAASLPPTPENQKIIAQALGQDSARSGTGGSTDLAGNGGYVTVGKGADGQPAWQWNAYDSSHPAPKGFDKPYAPFKADPGAGDASAAFVSGASSSETSTDPLSSGAPPGFNGCWPRPPGLHHINLHLMGGNGNRRVVDATPIVCSSTYCHAIGFTNRGCCPLRQEGASQHAMRVKCESELMGKDRDGRIGPRWVYKGNGGVEKQPVNAYLAWGYGNGWVGACSNVSPVCNWIQVINHPEYLAGSTTGYAGGGGGGGSSGSGSSSPSSSRSSRSPSESPTSSSNTASGDTNLESMIPVIPEVAPAVE